MIETIFSVLNTGLSLWLNHEKTKYVDKLIKLREQYNAEINKPTESRSDAALDDILFDLRILGLAFSASVSQQNAQV